jgi:hypothetical protein
MHTFSHSTNVLFNNNFFLILNVVGMGDHFGDSIDANFTQSIMK